MGAEPRNLAPESPGVVHLFEMGEFMQDDVIANELGRLDETPVKGNGGFPRAGAPAGTLVTDRDSADDDLMQGCQFSHARWEFARRQAPEMALDHRAEVGDSVGSTKALRTKADDPRLA